MDKAILVPETIVAGYRNSSSSNIKKAYISFINENNKINKESKFEQYIESKESLENKPISGFTLNKHEQTYINEYTEGRTYVSLFDPRGFVFKISVGNFIRISLSTDINKGEIKGTFVYAFINGYPILLNVESKEYKDSLNRQDEMRPVNAGTVKVGQYYCLKRDAKKNKNPDRYIYLGKYKYHEIDSNNVFGGGDFYITDKDKGEKHIFMLDGKDRSGNIKYEAFMPNSLLTIDNSDYVDENVDCYIDDYLKTKLYKGISIKYLDERIETKIENGYIKKNNFIAFVGDKVYFAFSKGVYGENAIEIDFNVFNSKDFDESYLISRILNKYMEKDTFIEYRELYEKYKDDTNIYDSCNDDVFKYLMDTKYSRYSLDGKPLQMFYQFLTDNGFKPFVYE